MKILRCVGLVVVSAAALVAAPCAVGQPSGAQSAAPMSDDDLDTLLAPIALYPDALVVQILQCAASPFQVRAVSEWLDQNPDLKGTAAQDAATEQGFDASFVAIVLFPDIVHMMNEQADWTRDLGQAFTTNRDGVLESVQRLRSQAEAAGNLATTDQQSVQSVTTDDGQTVITIAPSNPQVVYVPQYDPDTVYTEPASNSGNVAAAAIIGFAAGVIVGAEADDHDDQYYYAYGGWGYARPVCYPGGYNDFYKHRERMADDYYDHRQDMRNDYYDYRRDMTDQRGENQAGRQDARTDVRGDRQDAQGARQDTRTDARSTRQTNTGARQDARQGTVDQRATNRSTGARSTQSVASTRGSYPQRGQSATRQTGTNSGAFNGYQRGSTTRASSSRGRSSMSASQSRGGGRRR